MPTILEEGSRGLELREVKRVKSHYRGVEFTIERTNHLLAGKTEWTWKAFPGTSSGRVDLQGVERGNISDAMKACFTAIDRTFSDYSR